MEQESNSNSQQQRPACPGNCLRCIPAQRQYCASQHAYSNMKVLDRVMETLTLMQSQMEAMQGSVTELALKIEAIQSGEATVFDPAGEGELFPRVYGEADREQAQEEDGAENRSSQK